MNLASQKEKIASFNIQCEGCTNDEIEAEAKKWNLKLPSIYKEFLALCGKNSNHLFCGMNIGLKNWSYINKCGIDIYKEVHGSPCPSELFFIMEHHGYSCYYFDTKEGENPDIYVLISGDEVTRKVLGKLDQILDLEIEKLRK